MTKTTRTDGSAAGGPIRQSRGIATFARMARLALKELRETLRDRRTILTLVLMPLLVYPLLSLTFQRLLLTSLPTPGGEVYLIAVESDDAQQVAEAYLATGRRFLSEQRQREQQIASGQNGKTTDSGERKTSSKSIGDAWMPSSGDPNDPEFRVDVVEDVQVAVTAGRYDVGIRISHRFQHETLLRIEIMLGLQQPTQTAASSLALSIAQASVQKAAGLTRAVGHSELVFFELIHRKNSPLSRKTLAAVERSLDIINAETRVRNLERLSVPRHLVPVQLSRREIKGKGAASPYSLAALVPLILILMTVTGAVYPAIDLTAGERERGTLEMLVAAPVPRLGLLLAKYSAVLLVAMMTATVNLVGMTLTIVATGLGPLIFGSDGLSPITVAAVFGLMLLFAAFFSAVLLVLTSIARTFKEAQAYLIPLMLVSIAPGILSMIPDLKLDGWMLVTPLANIVLLSRDLFLGQADIVAAAVVILTTVFYAAAALSVAAKLFGTDAILYGSQGSWSDLFRRPKQSVAAATVSAAMMTLAFLFPATILLSQLVQSTKELTFSMRLLLNGVLLIALFAGVPMVVAAIRRVRMPECFALRAPGVFSLPAAILLGISLWPFVFELIMATKALGFLPDASALKELTEQLVVQLRSVSPLLVLLSLAVIPGVCEEFFFRGFLLSSFRERLSDTRAIIATAVLFGLFHVVVRDMLAIERLLPSTLMGLVLGWVCVRTGSLYPGMILHAAHNGLLLMAAYYQPELIERNILADEQSHLPANWLAGAAAIATVGFVLMWFAGRNGSGKK